MLGTNPPTPPPPPDGSGKPEGTDDDSGPDKAKEGIVLDIDPAAADVRGWKGGGGGGGACLDDALAGPVAEFAAPAPMGLVEPAVGPPVVPASWRPNDDGGGLSGKVFRGRVIPPAVRSGRGLSVVALVR